MASGLLASRGLRRCRVAQPWGARCASVATVDVVKRSTGIVGLDVVPNARAELVKLYAKTLQDVKIMPENVAYRKAVENFTKFRMYAVLSSKDDESAASAIGSGQLEELIEQAREELKLIPLYASWKIWELKQPSPVDDTYAELFDGLTPEEVEQRCLQPLLDLKKTTVATKVGGGEAPKKALA